MTGTILDADPIPQDTYQPHHLNNCLPLERHNDLHQNQTKHLKCQSFSRNLWLQCLKHPLP